ncbi:TonB-linked SusC/RagA family outer membrane protein [Parabacteroides sp. PM5-20]|nr:TonB-linked SusC/RagA family outer membrane protein [Parabacteroides sp. PM5-20]
MNKVNGKWLLHLFLKEKKLRITKLVLLLSTLFLVQVAANTYAQSTRLNLNLKQSTLKSALKEIESQTEFSFFYNDDEIDMNQLVSIHAKNENLESILTRMLPNCQYVIENKKVILIPKAKNLLNAPMNNQQDNRVSGTITDNTGEPIPGASVSLKGTSQGVITDIDGNYQLVVPANATLEISYIGYKSQVISVNGRNQIHIIMEEDTQLVDEVVVVGFAKQKKANLTGSVSAVKVGEILGDRPITTAGNILQGTIPGLQATVSSGQPGSGYSFNIRGETSINGGSPLIVVDNVPYAGAIELINPDDIESITVLKDGGAAAIYGSRSTFGVILITTKGASLEQKFQLDYRNNFTFTNPFELPVKASPMDAMQAFKDMGLSSVYTGHNVDEWMGYLTTYNSNPSMYPNGYVINEQGTRYSLRESDILGDFFGTGFEQKHDITASGGSKSHSYRISFGYTNQDGVMASNKDRFERYNFRSYTNAKLTNWLTGQVDVSYIKSENTTPNRADYQWAVAYPSYVEMVDLDINGELVPAGSPANQAKLGGKNVNARNQSRITGKLIANPLEGLVLNAEYTYDDLRRTQKNHSKTIRVTNPPKYEAETHNSIPSLSKTEYKTMLSVWNIYGSYTREFNKHNLTGLLGFNQEVYDYEWVTSTGKDFISNQMPSFNLAQEWDPITDGYTQYSLRGYFGRINYDYNNRYLLELNGRYDGSSKFPSGHRWGFFPSVSVAWRIMQEPFMESFLDYVPEFKVRASYSTIGNQNVSAYQFNPSMGGSKAVWIADGTRPNTLGAPGLVSDNFTWETVESYNLGFDISLLRNRFQANVDLYQRNTRDMLTDAIELPAVVGASAPKQNVANLSSKGFELEFKWNDQIGKVRYHIGVNLYNYNSKITKYSNETGLFYQQNSAQDAKRYREGMKVGEIWGYTFDRFYQENDFVDGKLKEGIAYVRGRTPKPGDVLFVDHDGDGMITTGAMTTEDPGDQKIIGNSSLKLQYGIHGGLSWNNIAFSFIMQGVGKRDMWLSNYLTQPFQYEYGTIYAHQLNYWTPTNTNPEYPRLYPTGSRDGNYASNFSRSDKYLINGAYLHVKNLSLSYTLPRTLVSKIGLDNIRVYGTVENPFIFNHMPEGLDPTLSGGGSGLGYPLMRSYSVGFSFSL